MKIDRSTKEMLVFSSQACINTYQGDHGKVDYSIYQSYTSFDTGDVEFDIGLWKDFIVIAFEGSDGKDDWKHNFDVKKVHSRFILLEGEALVHDGFDQQGNEAFKAILSELTKKQYIGIRKILVTGHSLGGALATLIALALSIHYSGAMVYCVTEGAPRVGNAAFVKAFNKLVFEAYRVVYDMDTVTKVPPVWLGFRHGGILISIGDMSWWEYPIHPVLWITGNPIDHYPEKYDKGIKKIKVRK